MPGMYMMLASMSNLNLELSLGTRLIGRIHTGGRHIKCESDFEWHARTGCISVFSATYPCALHSDNFLDEKQEIITTLAFILMQVLYLVGIILVTFDLLTCTQSQGNCHQITLERRCLCSHWKKHLGKLLLQLNPTKVDMHPWVIVGCP